MNILVVTYRYGADIHGGGERFVRELMTRLAAKGHHVEVFTTRSQNLIASPLGYMVWDNFLPPGKEMDDGVEIYRYRVKSARPGRGRRRMARLQNFLEEERRGEKFSRLLGEALRGTRDFCFLSGWHRLEKWEDGPARWTWSRARLVAGGENIRGLELDLYSPWGGTLKISVDGEPKEFRLTPGKRETIRLAFPSRDLVGLLLHGIRVARPPGDARELGVAVRKVNLLEKDGARELSLERGWTEFLETAPEELLGKLLWPVVEERPRRLQRWHGYLMGPRSRGLQRAVLRAASRCDLVVGTMVPMTTLELAWKAARKAGKPFVAIPLFHPRDYNHYWPLFRRAMLGAAAVEANSPAIREIMKAWGLPAFSIGPGVNMEDFSSAYIDGDRFRRELGLENVPMLLWVGRKNASKGYPEAVAVVRRLREKGLPAVLVMVGPDDDGRPLPAEGVVYLGPLPREKLMDAYDACDLFIFPSLNESFCLVFCEAWLRGKPVLGNLYCAAARGQIEHGVDGYLCADVEDYTRRAWELLTDKEKAIRMGEKGREKVRRERDWNRLVETYEKKLEQLLHPDSGSAHVRV